MCFQALPMPESREISDAYRVFLNDIEIPVYSVRVSAIPYNRRWPGYQRSMEQTELASFVRFAMDTPVCVRVIPQKPVKTILVRPQARGIVPKKVEEGYTFMLDRPGGCTFEADGRSCCLHILANPVLPVPAPGGGPVFDIAEGDPLPEACPGAFFRFGPGCHRVGRVEMVTGQTLYLAPGAVLYGHIVAKNADHIRILGPGVIDGSENHAVIHFAAHGDGSLDVHNATREHTIFLDTCRDVTLSGFAVLDSLLYTLYAVDCEDVEIQALNILGCWRYNSDGLDFHNCSRCHVADCFLRTYDDSICVKGCMEAHLPVSRDILVERCVIWNDWGQALEFGAETCADEICCVVWRDCDLIRITGSACDVQSVDYADIHDVVYENIRVEVDDWNPAPRIQKADGIPYDPGDGSYQPRILSANILHHYEYSATERSGRTHDILFRNIRVLAGKLPPSVFAGFGPENEVYDIAIENLCWNGRRLTSLEQARVGIGQFVRNVSIR